MLWLTVMRLPDGSRVESGMATSEKVAAGATECSFRLHRPDGVVHEFSTLTSILDHLDQHYNAEDVKRATTNGRPLDR